MATRWQQKGLFTCQSGDLGSGKTYSAMHVAVEALRNNEPVFTNVAMTVKHLKGLETVPVFDFIEADYDNDGSLKVSDGPIQRYGNYSKGSDRGPCIVRWERPFDLLRPEVRCGTVIFDELGALAAARNWEDFPFGLTVKLIHLRKSHLEINATVQDDQIADKNIRRFYSRVWKLSEISLPFLGLFKKSARRPVLKCGLEGCTKNHQQLTEGDRPGKFPYKATFYRRYDIHPAYTTNKEKHHSQGSKYIWFDPEIAKCYQSAQSVSAAAEAAWREAAATQKKFKKRSPSKIDENEE